MKLPNDWTRPQWTRKPDEDQYGRTGYAWMSDCGQLCVTDSGPPTAPFEALVKVDKAWRAISTEPDQGFFKTLQAAKRAASKARTA